MNILITSVGRRTYMVEFFRAALNKDDLIFASNSDYTYALKSADNYVITPSIYDSNYIDFVLDFCLQNNIKAVVSLFDIDLPILAKNKNLFADRGIHLIVSDYEMISICNDKWLTYGFLIENNFKTPKTYLNIFDAKCDIKSGNVNYPLILKPRWGMGSIGVFTANNEIELDVLYNKTLEIIKNSYLKFESGIDLVNSVLIQEKLNGEEYGLDIFNDFEGNSLCVVPKKKLAMRAGETDIAEIIKDPHLEYCGRELGKVTRHIANLDVDIFIEESRIYILEMNARFGGQYPFSHLSGVNFVQIIVDYLYGREIQSRYLEFEPIRAYKDLVIKTYDK